MRRQFDMMRYQHCSETLLPYIKRNKFRVFFWIFAFLALFCMLGAYPAARSEARWFQVVREMLRSGDWLHPTINGNPYFDKPLVSYWLAAILAKLSGGEVTEFICRVPSVFFALLAIKCTMSIAEFLTRSKRAGMLAGWLLLSSYPLMIWGRLAEADMEQTGFIVAAVATYLKYREKPGFGSYLLFWGLCAIGAQTKGLAALIIPPMLAVIDIAIRKDWKKHISLSGVGAFFCGILIYLVPFILEMVTAHGYGANGLLLVFRENLVRVFNPWDHKSLSPFCYFEYVPTFLLPWTLYFLLALVDTVIKWIKERKAADKENLWIVLSIVAIFLLFSVSRSRRSYYILPIVPFCMAFTAAWLSVKMDSVRTACRKISDGFLQFCEYVIPAWCLLLFMMPFVLKPMVDANLKESGAMDFVPSITLYDKFSMSVAFTSMLCFVLGIALFIWWLLCRRELKRGTGYAYFTDGRHPVNRTVVFYAILSCLFFSVFLPVGRGAELFSPIPTILKSLTSTIDNNAKNDPTYYDRVVFFGAENDAEIVYYLGLKKPIKTYSTEVLNDENRQFLDDSVTLLGLDDFRAKLHEIQEKGGMVITHAGRIYELEDEEIKNTFIERFGHYLDGVLPVDFEPFKESKLYKNKIGEDEKSQRDYQRGESKRLLLYIVTPPVSGEPEQTEGN